MDVLADALRALRVKTEVYGRLELTAPWGIELAMAHPGYFHSVSRGGCWLTVDGQSVALAAGDWVFVLGGAPHVLSDTIGSHARPLPDIYEQTGAHCGGVLHYGGAGPATTLVSFSFTLDGSWLNPRLSRLPRVLHVKGDGAGPTRWVESIVQLAAAEMEAARPGHEIIATRIADVLLVQALRTHAAALEAGGWLHALEDPRLGAVLQRVHERPEQPWTVEAMARTAGMSRSMFAARFRTIVGEGPLSYLTRWRMHKAMQAIRDGDASLGAIAESVGYGDDSAFGKAFKRQVGLSPAAYRRRAQGETKPRART
jgi:AraC-like DNA-binding protein